METTRQNKICRLLQKELSEIFLITNKIYAGHIGISQCCAYQS